VNVLATGDVQSGAHLGRTGQQAWPAGHPWPRATEGSQETLQETATAHGLPVSDLW